MDMLIKNGTVVTADEMFKADVAVNDGKIVMISSEIDEILAKNVVDSE